MAVGIPSIHMARACFSMHTDLKLSLFFKFIYDAFNRLFNSSRVVKIDLQDKIKSICRKQK